jgi:hypothetical protein
MERFFGTMEVLSSIGMGRRGTHRGKGVALSGSIGPGHDRTSFIASQMESTLSRTVTEFIIQRAQTCREPNYLAVQISITEINRK